MTIISELRDLQLFAASKMFQSLPIPSRTSILDIIRILKLSSITTQEYRAAALFFHPDKYSNNEATKAYIDFLLLLKTPGNHKYATKKEEILVRLEETFKHISNLPRRLDTPSFNFQTKFNQTQYTAQQEAARKATEEIKNSATANAPQFKYAQRNKAKL